MDLIIVISVIILLFIVVLEFIGIFHGKSCNENILDYAVIVPVFSSDSNFSIRLDCLSEKIACGHCHAEEIILIDFDASSEQLELCKRFCLEYPCALIACSKDIEKIFYETFAIDTEK